MVLKDSFNEFRKYALLLPMRYEDYSIDELANKYCEATDTKNMRQMNIYSSALILRFWFMIEKIFQKTKTAGVDREDVLFRIFNTINIACELRAWQKNPKLNAQQCISQMITSRVEQRIMYDSNLQKNKVNANLISLDTPINSEDGHATIGDFIEDETQNVEESGFADSVISGLLRQNRIIDAMIVERYVNTDCDKHEKYVVKEVDEDGKEVKYTRYTSEKCDYKLVQELNAIDEGYIKYFARTYGGEIMKLQAAYDALKTATNTKKYKFITATFDALKAEYAQ